MLALEENLREIQKEAEKIELPTFNIRMNIPRADILAMEIMEYARLANNVLSNISTIVENSAVYYSCSSATKYRNKFKKLEENFPILIQNMENYALSIKKAERLYKAHAEVVVSGLDKKIASIAEQR